MKRLIKESNRPYDIVIEDSFDHLDKTIREIISPSSICIITDSHIAPLYLDEVKAVTQTIAPTYTCIFTAGESSKQNETLNELYNMFIQNGIDRQSLIIALGGGVVGDLAGFAAATFMRGIAYVQIPTTILSQNDSSIGGKVGIDYLNYKNMIGSFYNPLLVYTNLATLKTLPRKELVGGMAEVIKHGLIYNVNLFEYLCSHQDDILNLKEPVIEIFTYESCKVKCTVVEKDQKELGLRKILNFGHTIGHALETLSHFEYSHGESVAYGMCMSAFISYKRCYLNEDKLHTILKVCKNFGLLKPMGAFSADAIWEQMKHDKKSAHGKIDFILLKNIGETIIVKDVTKEEVTQALYFISKTCK